MKDYYHYLAVPDCIACHFGLPKVSWAAVLAHYRRQGWDAPAALVEAAEAGLVSSACLSTLPM
eukprot:1576031-Alexandrium_andersonii.AAC.1